MFGYGDKPDSQGQLPDKWCYNHGKGESEEMGWWAFSSPSAYHMEWLSENQPGPTYIVDNVDLDPAKSSTGDLVFERAHYALRDWVKLVLTVSDGFSNKTYSFELDRDQPLDWDIDTSAQG